MQPTICTGYVGKTIQDNEEQALKKRDRTYTQKWNHEVILKGGEHGTGCQMFHEMRAQYFDYLEYCLRKEFDEKLKKQQERIEALEKALADTLAALAAK